MKKQIRNVAVMALLVSMATGCQKEILNPQTEGNCLVTTVSEKKDQAVMYTVDGENHRIIISDNMAWKDFLYNMLDMAENGSTIRIVNNNNVAQSSSTKEVVIYTTSDKDAAVAWCDAMYANGYTVQMNYDYTNNVFVCIAEK